MPILIILNIEIWYYSEHNAARRSGDNQQELAEQTAAFYNPSHS